jgi:hypothetical protein
MAERATLPVVQRAPARRVERPWVHRRAQPAVGFRRQLPSFQMPAKLVVAVGLHPVALGEMRSDQGVRPAFPQRLDAHRGKRDLHRLGVPVGLGQAVTQHIQPVQHPLTHALALQQRPVLEASEQQLEDVDVPRLHLEITGGGGDPDQPIRSLRDHVRVHQDGATEAQDAAVRGQHTKISSMQLPQRRPKSPASRFAVST